MYEQERKYVDKNHAKETKRHNKRARECQREPNLHQHPCQPIRGNSVRFDFGSPRTNPVVATTIEAKRAETEETAETPNNHRHMGRLTNQNLENADLAAKAQTWTVKTPANLESEELASEETRRPEEDEPIRGDHQAKHKQDGQLRKGNSGSDNFGPRRGVKTLPADKFDMHCYTDGKTDSTDARTIEQENQIQNHRQLICFEDRKSGS